jgi:hypothetical protein
VYYKQVADLSGKRTDRKGRKEASLVSCLFVEISLRRDEFVKRRKLVKP